MATQDLKEKLSTWGTVNKALMAGDEKECNSLLAYETRHQARLKIMLRIHSRLCRLRNDRERADIINQAKTGGYSSKHRKE